MQEQNVITYKYKITVFLYVRHIYMQEQNFIDYIKHEPLIWCCMFQTSKKYLIYVITFCSCICLTYKKVIGISYNIL